MLMTQFFFCDFDNINNTEETINDELIKLTEWLGCNQLSLNVNKTKFMLFHSNRKAVNYHNRLIMAMLMTMAIKIVYFDTR